MRRLWTLCALMLSLTVSVSTAAAVTRSSLSHPTTLGKDHPSPQAGEAQAGEPRTKRGGRRCHHGHRGRLGG